MAPHEALWINDNGDSWHVRAELARSGERIEVVGMHVRSYRDDDQAHLEAHLPTRDAGPPALDSTTWRSLGTLARDLRETWFEAIDGLGLLDQPGNEHAAAAWRAPKDRVKIRQTEVADVFKSAQANGESGTKAVAQRFNISEPAAAKRIQRAREAKHLPAATRGRPRRTIEGN